MTSKKPYGRSFHPSYTYSLVTTGRRGDAPPRPSDLAYDLPADFDPYASPPFDDLTLSAAAAGRPLADFFASHSPIASLGEELSTPRMGSVYNMPYNMPDLMDARALSDEGHLDTPMALRAGAEGKGLTLEEIGKRRHLEWVESRRAEGVGW